MAMEVDRLTVKVDTDFRGLTSGLQSATRNIQGFKKEVEGTQAQMARGADFPVRADTRQVDLAKSKVGGLRQDLSSGGTFEVRADDSQLAGVSTHLSALRSDAANGATFNVRADESGLAGIAGSLSAIRSDAANGATFSLRADESGITGIGVSLDRIRQDAANGATFNIDADVTGLAGATTAIQAIKTESASADDTININANVDTAGATAQLGVFQGLVSWFDGKNIDMPVNVNTISAVAGLFSVQAAVISTVASIAGLSLTSAVASGSLTGLGATAATVAAGVLSIAAAGVAIYTALQLAQTGASALLGGLAAVGGAAALAATGFGLIAAAGYVLYTMVQDNTNGLGYLSESLSKLKEDFMTAFEPAAIALAPLAQQLIELADSALPYLGQQAVIATEAMKSGFDSVVSTIASAPMMESDVALFFENMPTVVESLTTAVGNFGAGLFSILAQASPAAAELAQWIQGIAESFFQWTQSEEGRATIAKWLDDAAIILPAIRDAIVEIVDAFSNMEGFDAESLASGIRGIGTAVAGIISFVDKAKQGWDAFDTAINATLDFIVSWIPEVNLLDKIMGEEEGVDASAENPILVKLMGWWEGVAAWSPAALAFDLSTFLFGGGEEGEEGAANPLLTKLMGWWEGVAAWSPAALAFDLSTFLFGGEEEGEEGEANPLLTKLMGWWEGVTAWTPAALAIDLATLLFGGGEEGEGEGEENPLLTKLMGWWEGVVAWTPAALAIDLTTLLFGGGEEGGEGEGGENPILTKLMGWWEGVAAWTPAALAIDLTSLLFGEEGGENPLLTKLTEWWDAAMTWLGGLVPDISLTDIILGVADVTVAVDEFIAAIGDAFINGWATITQTFSDFFTSLYNDYWLYYFGTDGVLVTGIVEFFTTLYNDYWLYYFGTDGVLVTGIVEFFTTLYNDYWLYYFGLDGVLISGIIEFFTTLYNDYWLYYFGLDGVLVTGIIEFFTTLYNDYWLYYFGLDGVLITEIINFFTSLYNDYWLYYFGLDGVLVTEIINFFTTLYNDYWLYYFGLDGVLISGIIDFFTTLYNDYWLYYFGTDGVLIAPIIEFFTTLYNDYFLYYLGPEGVIVTAVQDAWDAILAAIPEFVRGFGNLLGNGLAAGINAGIGYLQGLLDAIDSVLTAINVSPLGVTLPTVTFQEFAKGGSTESMAAGGSRGGAGSSARDPRHIIWNEGMGEEYWIATGPAADKRKNVGWLAKAAGKLGLGVVPMQAGGFAQPGLADSLTDMFGTALPYSPWIPPAETATSRSGARTGTGTAATEKPLTKKQKRKAKRRDKRARKRKRRQGASKATTATTAIPTTGTTTTPTSGAVPMQTGGAIASFAQPSFSDNLIEKLYRAGAYTPWAAPVPETSTGAGTGAGTAAGTAAEKPLTKKQKRRARRQEKRARKRGTGTTSTATTTMPTSSVPGTSAVDAMPAATSDLAAPAGMTRVPTATGGSRVGRQRGPQRGRTHRGGARFSNMHRGRRRHKRAAGGDTTFMAIGGGTDTGPAGLGERAGGIAQEIMDAFGVWANTYVGGATPHGSLHGNVPENTFDFWGDSGFSPLDPATGDAIRQYLYDNYGSELDTVIWNGLGEGPGGAFEDFEHGEHLHASIGGGGILGAAGVLAASLFNKMKGIWDSAMAALAAPDMGEGALWDGIETYLMTLPAMAWEWLKSKVPRGTGGSLAGLGRGGAPLSGDLQSMAEQAIEAAGWPASELQALTDLWQNESGWDANAVNPESGAYGIPQINPASWPDGPPVGDAAGQIAWGVDYIKNHPAYGTPTAALDFWLANGWYARGGVVPGSAGAPQSAVVHGGERVLPQNINQGFENLAKAVDRWDSAAASGMGGGGANNEAEAVLEEILVEMKRGNDNPTPVEVNNVGALKAAFVAGAYAAQDSELGANITDRQVSEGIRYFMEMQ